MCLPIVESLSRILQASNRTVTGALETVQITLIESQQNESRRAFRNYLVESSIESFSVQSACHKASSTCASTIKIWARKGTGSCLWIIRDPLSRSIFQFPWRCYKSYHWPIWTARYENILRHGGSSCVGHRPLSPGAAIPKLFLPTVTLGFRAIRLGIA